MAKVERGAALDFLKKIGLNGGEELLLKNRLAFLTSLIKALYEYLPFQTVNLVAGEYGVPSLEEVVGAGLRLEGGVCYTLNIFLCLLLRSLGLDAHVLDASYSGLGDTHDHVVGLVQHLRWEGDTYVVEMGCGFPTAGPVSVASLPVVGYCAGLEYSYQWHGDHVVRLHRAGDSKPLKGEKPVMRDDWRQIFHFSLKPVNFEFFTPYMKPIYTTSDFTETIRAVRFPPAGSVLPYSREQSSRANPNKECQETTSIDPTTTIGDASEGEEGQVMVAIVNQSLLFGHMDAPKKMRVSEEDLAPTIKHYFPNIPPAKVDLAVQRLMDQIKASS